MIVREVCPPAEDSASLVATLTYPRRSQLVNELETYQACPAEKVVMPMQAQGSST
jgi:hypothetical protein